MCQAYEGEANFVIAQEASCRRNGYEARQAGQPLDANPEYYVEHKKHWEIGWILADTGRALW